MAYIRLEFCNRCGIETNHINMQGCVVCLNKAAKEKEKMWEAQDVDTKLTDLRKRIEKLKKPQVRF